MSKTFVTIPTIPTTIPPVSSLPHQQNLSTGIFFFSPLSCLTATIFVNFECEMKFFINICHRYMIMSNFEGEHKINQFLFTKKKIIFKKI